MNKFLVAAQVNCVCLLDRTTALMTVASSVSKSVYGGCAATATAAFSVCLRAPVNDAALTLAQGRKWEVI